MKPNTDAGGGHDLAFEGGDFALVDGAEAARQDVEVALRTFLGESKYDTQIGVPYLQVIFQRGTTLDAARFIIEQAILARPGIAEVLSLDVRRNNETREATITGRARLETGEEIAIETGVTG